MADSNTIEKYVNPSHKLHEFASTQVTEEVRARALPVKSINFDVTSRIIHRQGAYLRTALKYFIDAIEGIGDHVEVGKRWMKIRQDLMSNPNILDVVRHIDFVLGCYASSSLSAMLGEVLQKAIDADGEAPKVNKPSEYSSKEDMWAISEDCQLMIEDTDFYFEHLFDWIVKNPDEAASIAMMCYRKHVPRIVTDILRDVVDLYNVFDTVYGKNSKECGDSLEVLMCEKLIYDPFTGPTFSFQYKCSDNPFTKALYTTIRLCTSKMSPSAWISTADISSNKGAHWWLFNVDESELQAVTSFIAFIIKDGPSKMKDLVEMVKPMIGKINGST